MKSSFIILLTLVVFSMGFSCGQKKGQPGALDNEPTKPVHENGRNTPLQNHISLDTFSTFPPQIDGCSCYFSTDEQQFREQVYIYADNYQETAFVRINGAMTLLLLESARAISPTHTIKTFTNQDYRLTLDLEQVSQREETWQQKGTLMLRTQEGKTVVKEIFGECGC